MLRALPGPRDRRHLRRRDGRRRRCADFLQFYRAAQAILAGNDPYVGTEATTWGGPYPYPPLPAIVAAPFTALSDEAAGLLVMALLVIVALAIPYVLGVRDWRCYGLLLLWPPVISAIQTGNVTLWFALVAAIAWRFRDRVAPVSASIGVTLAAKFFLWPLVVWLAADAQDRGGAVGVCCRRGPACRVLGRDRLRGVWVPALLDLEDKVGADSYTAYIVGLDLGLPAVARAIWLAVGIGLLASVVVLGRRGTSGPRSSSRSRRRSRCRRSSGCTTSRCCSSSSLSRSHDSGSVVRSAGDGRHAREAAIRRRSRPRGRLRSPS